jgi:hypothetical protein
MYDTFLIPKSYTYHKIKLLILEKSQKQFKEKCDITFQFQEIKTGKKVTAINFIIRDNNKYIFDYMQNIKTFIRYIRKNYINFDLFKDDDKNMLLSVCPKGRLYNKRNGLSYDKKQAEKAWNILYNLAKEKKKN